MGNTPCVCTCAEGNGRNGSAKIVEPSLSPGSGILSVDDFLAEYDGEKLLERSTLESTLGVSDKLSLVRHRATHTMFLCRVFPRDVIQLKKTELYGHFLRLKMLDHPHISQFIEGYLGKQELVIVYKSDGNQLLLKYIENSKTFQERDVCHCIRQLAMALSAAHESGFTHGNLTPWSVHATKSKTSAQDNSPCHVKLDSVGLGLCVVPSALTMAFPSDEETLLGKDRDIPELRHTHLRVVGSTPPEVRLGEVKCQKLGKASQKVCKMDVWGLGVIAFYLLTGHLPFMPRVGQPMEQFLEAILDDEVSFSNKYWASYPDVAKDCIASMLRTNCFLRPDASTLLKHPWLRLAEEKLDEAQVTGILRNIFHNAAEGSLKRLVLRIIAHGNVPLQHRSTAEVCFRFLDSSSDGLVNKEELTYAIRAFLPKGEGTDEDIASVVQKIDTSGDGSINFMEFLSASLSSAEVINRDQLLAVFKTFDIDGSGTITLEEIEHVVKKLSVNVDGHVQAALADVKAEAGDGQFVKPVSLTEFIDLLTMPAGKAKEWQSTAKRIPSNIMSIFGGSMELEHVEALNLDLATQSAYAGGAGVLQRQISKELGRASQLRNIPLLDGENSLTMELLADRAQRRGRHSEGSASSGDLKAKLRSRSPSPEFCDFNRAKSNQIESFKSQVRSGTKDGTPRCINESSGSQDLNDRTPSRASSPEGCEFNRAKSIKIEISKADARKKTKDGAPSSPTPSTASTMLPGSTSCSPSVSRMGSKRRSNSKKESRLPSSPKSHSIGEEDRRMNLRRHTG